MRFGYSTRSEERIPAARRLSSCVGIAILLIGVLPAKDSNRATEFIQPADLKADLQFLASDDLRGRNAGSTEDAIASAFIASQFTRLQLKAVGDDGTYFQNMEIDTADIDREHTSLRATIAGVERSFIFDKDFHWVRQSLHQAQASGALVFAGYGINAPEFQYNDFAQVDVRGKIVMVLAREPRADDPNAKFAGTWDTYHAFNWEKVEEIRKRGAAGLLLIENRVPRNVKPTPASSPRPSGGPNFALAGPMWNLPTFLISRDVADQLLAPGGKTTDQLQSAIDATVHPASLDVPDSSASLSKAVRDFRAHKGRNVVGLLEGSDPKLKSEVIILTAHHDHMGVANGHTYNGADDDGSGVAGLLEIATAFVKGNVRPRRSILFISYDGEERIFLGSYYYVTHPVVPLAQTVANINMDMIGRDEDDANWPVPADRNRNMVNVLGTRYNPALRAVIDHENKNIGLRLDYKMDVVDPDSLWSRSDHFWFATLHIPQVEFQTGLHPDYHTDRDTWDRINYPKLTKIVRLVFLACNELAQDTRRIEFVPTAAGTPE